MTFPINAVRSHFPSLSTTDEGQRRIYFDNAAGTQVPKQTINRIVDFFHRFNSNTGVFNPTSVEVDALYADATQAMADFLGTDDPGEVLIGANMTTLTYQLSRSLAHQFEPGDEIIISRMEHEGNVTPWLQMAEDNGLTVKWLEFDRDSWRVEPALLEPLLSDRTRLLALNYASNLTGGVNDVKTLTAMAQAAGAIVYVDAVRDVEYEGPTRKLRVVTGPDSEVGAPGVFDIEDGDGNAGSISTQDHMIFADRILNAWNHNNLNAYVDLRSSSHYSFTVDFESTIRDNSPLEDDVGELIIFEVSGNSIVQIEALDESGQVIGTPVIVGYGNEWKQIAPDRLYVGRYDNQGSPRCGSFEYKATGVDLTDLGVMELNTLRISRPTNAGCSDVRADTRIVGVKTSIVPTAAMVFD